MFQVKTFCVGLLLCLTFIGCGVEGGGNTPKPKTADIAALAKNAVNHTAEQITSTPNSASREMGTLIESLEAYARDYGGSFNELLDTAKSVQSELSGNPDQAKIESQLGRLTSAANKLSESAK